MTKNHAPQTAASWSLLERLQHLSAATAYAFQPKRISGMPNTCRLIAGHYLTPKALRQELPDPELSLEKPDGLAGICPDLSVDTLMGGYRSGLYQTSHAGPYKWWAPRERMVLFLDCLHLEKNLKRKLRQAKFTITFNKAFNEVVRQCAGPREQRRVQLSWIIPEVAEAFERLHAHGHAHSVEVWDEQGQLAGGLFGVSFGQIFLTESQFALQRDTSKIAFAILNRHLQKWGYALNDVRLWSPHLERLGCELIPRAAHLAIVRKFGQGENWSASWTPEPDLCAGDWDPCTAKGWQKDSVLRAIDAADNLVTESDKAEDDAGSEPEDEAKQVA